TRPWEMIRAKIVRQGRYDSFEVPEARWWRWSADMRSVIAQLRPRTKAYSAMQAGHYRHGSRYHKSPASVGFRLRQTGLLLPSRSNERFYFKNRREVW